MRLVAARFHKRTGGRVGSLGSHPFRYNGGMNEETNIRKARFWCGVGFTAYWSWLFCLLIAQVLGSPQEGLFQNIWLWCTGAHIVALVAVGLLARRFSPYACNPCVAASISAIMVAGMGLLLVGLSTSSTPLVLVSLMAIGSGTALMVACWGEMLAALSGEGEQRTLLLCCLAASIVLYLVLAMLPAEMLYVVLFALPIVASVALQLCAGKLESPIRTGAAGEGEEKLTSRFVLFCLVYSLPLGFFQVKFALVGSGLASWIPVLAPSLAVLALIGVVDVAAKRRWGSNIVPAVLVPGAIAGLLLLALFEEGAPQLAGVLIFSTQQLLTVVLYARFALLSSRGKAIPAAVFALGVGATDAGFVVGMVAGELAQQGARYLEFTLGVAYVVVLGGFLAAGAFRRKDQKADGDGSANGLAFSSGVDRTVRAVALECGLTAREEEVLGHLLRGKSASAIAADIFLSKNTVRTHVSHIYQKTGVHTRDELVELVEHHA